MSKKINGGEFLGCRRIKGKVYIYDHGVRFLVKEAELQL